MRMSAGGGDLPSEADGEAHRDTAIGSCGIDSQPGASAKVRLAPDSLRVQATFTVKLEDHKVSIPSIVALKVSPEIKVNVDLLAKKN